MDFVYVVLAVILTGLMMVGIFTLGALFAIRISTDSHDEYQYEGIRIIDAADWLLM